MNDYAEGYHKGKLLLLETVFWSCKTDNAKLKEWSFGKCRWRGILVDATAGNFRCDWISQKLCHIQVFSWTDIQSPLWHFWLLSRELASLGETVFENVLLIVEL